MALVRIRQGDRLPEFRGQAFGADAPVNFPTEFTGGVVFKMVGPVTVTGSATGDSLGRLVYAWAAGDTDTPGAYEACFVATAGDGRTETFPNDSNIKIEIIEAL